ncbi:MAG: hypothetical protein AAFP90_09130 [Planctomycetota bacterium]
MESPNPYESPTAVAELDEPVSGIPEQTEAWIRFIATSWRGMFAGLVVAIVFFPIIPLVTLWYGTKLIAWFVMRNKYQQLQRPNAFDDSATLAIAFNDSLQPIAVGLLISILINLAIVIIVGLM